PASGATPVVVIFSGGGTSGAAVSLSSGPVDGRQTNGEAMINSIQNGDQPLPVIAQVSLTGNAQNAPPTIKDPKF
nr:hypothetical protein [Tanacetum cinerariifolium]